MVTMLKSNLSWAKGWFVIRRNSKGSHTVIFFNKNEGRNAAACNYSLQKKQWKATKQRNLEDFGK